MNMKRIAACLLAVMFASFAACAKDEAKQTNKQAENKQILTAIIEAEQWLILLDESKWEKAWDKASPLFKGQVSKKRWNKQIQNLLKDFGTLLMRKVASSELTNALPGAPDGKYAVILFDTTFKNKKKAVETVTMMLCKDSKWRLAGYYIK